ncbi:MAG: HNH endonuclease [Deltaproteobacteria bacterium]|nr:HNH endonuclease [Deltaproteobacteria bacterium]MBI3294903.1 HNH endonuclease [Deltaproteobacteria bacterium]
MANGDITVSVAKRITGVINPENQQDWLVKAKTLTQRSLELEVAKANPKEAVQEMIKPVSAERLEMKLGISHQLDQKLRRVRDLLGRKRNGSVRWEDAVEAMADLYLEKHDPVRRADRVLRKSAARETESVAKLDGEVEREAGDEIVVRKLDALAAEQVSRRVNSASAGSAAQVSERVPAESLHRVNLRDRGRCTHRDSAGERCGESRFTQIHHVVPRAVAGGHAPGDLRTLCGFHHGLVHETLGP